jgi:ribosomal protein S18 acetylase RimI-like enzyme
MKKIFQIKSQSDFVRCFSVLKELRQHLEFEEFIAIYKEANKSNGYELVAIENNGEIVAVMGYRILWDLVRGKHVYVDDLVSTAARRSQGLGEELLRYAEGVARAEGCSTLRLCAVIENERAIKFYDRLGWAKRSYAFTKKLKP